MKEVGGEGAFSPRCGIKLETRCHIGLDIDVPHRDKKLELEHRCSMEVKGCFKPWHAVGALIFCD